MAKWKGICNLKNAHRDQTGTNDNFDRLAKENSDWKYKIEVFDVIFVRRTGFVRISNLIEYISIEKPYNEIGPLYYLVVVHIIMMIN